MADYESPWSLALWRIYNAAIFFCLWITEVLNLPPGRLNRGLDAIPGDIIVSGLCLLAMAIYIDRDGCRRSRKKRESTKPDDSVL